jgi:hypothetical protein
MTADRIKNPDFHSGFWDDHRKRTARIVNAIRLRRRRGRLQLDWAWVQIGVAWMPWCPDCGVVCATGDGQLAHEQNVHLLGEDDEILAEIENSDGDELPAIED